MATSIVCGGGVRNLNGKVAGVTLLFTTENGTERWRTLRLYWELASGVGVTGAASGSIGTNSPNFDDILLSGYVYPLTTTGQIQNLIQYNRKLISVPPNTDININITTPAVATTCLINVWLMGFYDT